MSRSGIDINYVIPVGIVDQNSYLAGLADHSIGFHDLR